MKRALILTPTFYPDKHVSAIRIGEWCRNLNSFGYSPHVVCRNYGHTILPGESDSDLSKTPVYYYGPKPTEVKPPQSISTSNTRKRLLTELLSRLAVPDLQIYRMKHHYGEILRIAHEVSPSLVISSSPPHSYHWVARKLARDLGVAWHSDFRDPYTIDSRFCSRRAGYLKFFHTRFERSIYEQAELITFAIPLHFRWACRRFPSFRQKFQLLTNGIPDHLMRLLSSTRQMVGQLRVVCASSISESALNSVCTALQTLPDTRPISIEVLSERQTWSERTETCSPQLSVAFLGRLSHKKALEKIAKAHFLLGYLTRERSDGLGLSSKLFEFLATGVPSVLINPTRSDRLFLKRYPWCGFVREDNSLHQMKHTIYRVWKERLPNAVELENIRKTYSRRDQTKQLASWLNDITQH